MSALMAGRPRDALVFTAPMGGPVTDAHFRNRVWNPAVEAARLCGNPAPGRGQQYRRGACTPAACDDTQHKIRRFAPAGDAAHRGVLAGSGRGAAVRRPGPARHEDYATTQRYAHLAPDAHGKVREFWAGISDARATHDAKEGRSS